MKTLRYYGLAVFALLGYYLAEFIGLVPDLFDKSVFVFFPILVLWYGTILLIGDKLILERLLK